MSDSTTRPPRTGAIERLRRAMLGEAPFTGRFDSTEMLDEALAEAAAPDIETAISGHGAFDPVYSSPATPEAGLREALLAQRPDDRYDCWCRWPFAAPDAHSDHCKQARAALAAAPAPAPDAGLRPMTYKEVEAALDKARYEHHIGGSGIHVGRLTEELNAALAAHPADRAIYDEAIQKLDLARAELDDDWADHIAPVPENWK